MLGLTLNYTCSCVSHTKKQYFLAAVRKSVENWGEDDLG